MACGDRCPPRCVVNIHDPNRRLPCGHAAPNLPCWQAQQDLGLVACPVKVRKTVPLCGHEVLEPCHVDVTAATYTCSASCGANLPDCGHTCKKKCSTSNLKGKNTDDQVTISTSHGQCKQACKRDYNTCSHHCTKPCHPGQECKPCDSGCDSACSHSKCKKTCSEPCTPCSQPHCASVCPHSRCSQPCAAPCDNLPCSLRCSKMLACGHQCPSLCGEICPSAKYCQVCCTESVKNNQVDVIMGSSYGEIDLDDTPCIFPPCRHFVTVETMDGWMSMSDYFIYDGEGKIIDFNDLTARPFDIKEIKRPDKDAQLVAENIAQQLENRISFRRAMKSCMSRTMRQRLHSALLLHHRKIITPYVHRGSRIDRLVCTRLRGL